MDDSLHRIQQMLDPLEPARRNARGAAWRKGVVIAILFLIWFPLLFAGSFGGAWLGAQLTEGKPWAAILGFMGTPIAWTALMYKIGSLVLTQPRFAKLGYEIAFRDKIVKPLLTEAFPGFEVEPAGFISREVFTKSNALKPYPDQYTGRALLRGHGMQIAAVTADQTMGVFGMLTDGNPAHHVWLPTSSREAFAAHILIENSAEDLKLDLDAYRSVVSALQALAAANCAPSHDPE